MTKRYLLFLAIPLLVLLILPSASLADASVVQDSCVVVPGGPPPWPVWTYFTVVNFSLPVAVCDIHFIPEPVPPAPGCEMVAIQSPAGWSGFLDPLGGASWFANTPNDCIPPQGHKGEFAFLLDPAYCCYIVQFTDATGAVILEQEECFTCQKVPVEKSTWGNVKDIYR